MMELGLRTHSTGFRTHSCSSLQAVRITQIPYLGWYNLHQIHKVMKYFQQIHCQASSCGVCLQPVKIFKNHEQELIFCSNPKPNRFVISAALYCGKAQKSRTVFLYKFCFEYVVHDFCIKESIKTYQIPNITFSTKILNVTRKCWYDSKESSILCTMPLSPQELCRFSKMLRKTCLLL